GAAHVLCEDPPGLDAARDVDAHVAVERGADVLVVHRGRDADRSRLVAASRVEGAGDLALLVEDVAALLDSARDQHVPVDAEEVLAVETCLLDLLQRAYGLCFTADRHRGRTLASGPFGEEVRIRRLRTWPSSGQSRLV